MKRQRITGFLLARSADATRSVSIVATGLSGTLVSSGSPEQIGAGVSIALVVPRLDRFADRLHQRARQYSARTQQRADPRARRPAGPGVRAGGRPLRRGVPRDRSRPEPARVRPIGRVRDAQPGVTPDRRRGPDRQDGPPAPDRRRGPDRRAGPPGPDRRRGQDRRDHPGR